MNFRTLAISVGIGGGIMGLLSSLPVVSLGNYLCGLWIWSLSIFSVWDYIRRTGPGLTMTNGQGAIIGILTGLVGSIVSFIVFFFFYGGVTALNQGNADNLVGTVFGGTLVGGFIAVCGAWVLGPFIGAIGGRIAVELFGKPHI